VVVDLVCCPSYGEMGNSSKVSECWLLYRRLHFFGCLRGSISLGAFGGRWLDTRLGTHLFWIVGLVLGIVIAFYGVYQMLLPFIESKQNKGDS